MYFQSFFCCFCRCNPIDDLQSLGMYLLVTHEELARLVTVRLHLTDHLVKTAPTARPAHPETIGNERVLLEAILLPDLAPDDVVATESQDAVDDHLHWGSLSGSLKSGLLSRKRATRADACVDNAARDVVSEIKDTGA